MAINLDKVAFSSRLPAFKNNDSGSFTVSIFGTVGASATVTWTGSTSFTKNARMVRYSMQQSSVPAVAGYTASSRVPVAQMVGGSSLSPYLGCTVSGSPSVTSIAPNIYISSTQTGANVTVAVTNPNAGTMTMTSTVLTFYYTAFQTFGES